MATEPTPFEISAVQHVPVSARRVLLVGYGRGEAARLLKRRKELELHVLESNPALVERALLVADTAGTLDTSSARPPFPERHFDCMLLTSLEQSLEVIRWIEPHLNKTGRLVLRASTHASRNEDLVAWLWSAGLRICDSWPFHDQSPPDEGFGYEAVRHEYDAVAHARGCREAGHPDWGYDVLCGYYENARADLEARARMAAEKHACLVEMDRNSDPARRLLLFNAANMLFYQVTDVLPANHETYLGHAALWERVGDSGMARRILRTVQHLAPNDMVAERISACGSVVQDSSREVNAGPFELVDRPWRILFVVSPRPHYGLDVLYDGLCTVLGDDCVIEFPWKPAFHGETPAHLGHYPCTMNRKGAPAALESIVEMLRQRHFDVVLFGDMEHTLECESARRIVEAAGDVPLFLLDAQDECVDFFQETLDFLGVGSARGYFKREMLECWNYGPRVMPFPFAYQDHRIISELGAPRSHAFFWAGQRWIGLRDIYLRCIERLTGETFDTESGQDEYVAALRQSRMGLSGFGAGFDTVRYWELPANGCMLVSERPPIRIPHNFVDGVSAVLFDDLPDLEEKVSYYLNHLDEVDRIAAAGFERLRKFHTASARARQVLGWIQEMIRG